MRASAIVLALLCMPLSAQAATKAKKPAPLPVETIPAVLSLPADYPASWVLVHDLHFNSIVDGRVAIVDTSNPKQPLKGVVRAAQFASMLHAPEKREIYTSETFYSRLTQGERTDAITIWDTATLLPKAEILMPGGKRQQSVIYTGLFQFTNQKKWALVSNFTPAQSVTVVDLDGRKLLGEIDLPGCAHIYPTGARGFSSLCADGSMISIALNEQGGVESSQSIAAVQDIDHHPLFSMPAMVGQTAWFVSYHGLLHGFDLSGSVAKPLADKISVGTAEGGNPEWRPAGWQVIAADKNGLLYVLMTSGGREGSHKDGGTEVWVVDPAKKERVRRLPLSAHTLSITVTNEKTPRLVAARPDGNIDVYDAATGKLVHNLGAGLAFNPLILRPAQ